MNEDKLQLKQQPAIRKTLRYGGLIALGIGGLLTLIGMVSFFSSFGSSADSTWYRLSVGTCRMEDIEGMMLQLRKALTALK